MANTYTTKNRGYARWRWANKPEPLPYDPHKGPDLIINMKKLSKKDIRIPVLCQCYQGLNDGPNGEPIAILNPDCKQCNGKGWHRKSIGYFYVRKRPEEIASVTRDKFGKIRYWTSCSEFYEENAIGHILFYDEKDATAKCLEKNKYLAEKIRKICHTPEYRILNIGEEFSIKSVRRCYPTIPV